MNTYREVIDERFGGILTKGSHRENGEACALEAASVARGKPWTDVPKNVGLPDIRSLNDAPWSSDALRTEHLVPVVEALWSWPRWRKRRQDFAQRVVLRTIREILPIVLRACGLDDNARQCEQADNLKSAGAAAAYAAYAADGATAHAATGAAGAAAAYAAYAADGATAHAATGAAGAAADLAHAPYAARVAAAATGAAAHAAADAAATDADTILVLACRIWVEEAQRGG